MEPSIACAKAGVTTGEWGDGAARSVRRISRADRRRARCGIDRRQASTPCAREVERVSAKLGRRIKFLVGKPGLDGHSNGAEQIAVRARDCGMEVVYEGIRLTPAQIVNAALEEGVHVVGLSILSGSHVPLVGEVMERMRAAGLGDVPVVVGGIIPPEDAATLKGRASRASTRRRISSSTPSCATSSASSIASPRRLRARMRGSVPPGRGLVNFPYLIWAGVLPVPCRVPRRNRGW